MGNPRGRPIVFIHGFSQCWLQWNRQTNSSLVEDYRLVALDMRGHDLSDKPRDGYDDSKQWADDVNARDLGILLLPSFPSEAPHPRPRVSHAHRTEICCLSFHQRMERPRFPGRSSPVR